MIPVVESLEEAMKFFLENSSGECCCHDGDREEIVSCYPDAVKFFKGE
jgi:hypothetical protein